MLHRFFIRINEEMDNIKSNRVSLERNKEEVDDPVAILTDITKAYPMPCLHYEN